MKDKMPNVAYYWLVWFVFIFALVLFLKSIKPLWLMILAVVCVPVGNPIQTILEVNKNGKSRKCRDDELESSYSWDEEST